MLIQWSKNLKFPRLKIWKADHEYKANDVVLQKVYTTKQNLTEIRKSFQPKNWEKLDSIPHLVSYHITGGADMIEINSKNPENPYFLLSHPEGEEEIVESTVALLAADATAADFRLKVRSEAFWTEAQ